jgi:ubiquinone/menaquinone biosynthesis C-methylase UbiE
MWHRFNALEATNLGRCLVMKENIQVFEMFAGEYDSWFDANRFAYESEVLALRRFVPEREKGLEVGVGTGRFSVPLGVRIGVEPAQAMANIARNRGLDVYDAMAEDLPFADESFDFILMVTTICFLQDPVHAFLEAKRVLKPGGHVIVGMIDRDSFLGRIYESKKENSKFYRRAHFYSVKQVLEWLTKVEYADIRTCQTIFKPPEDLTSIEKIKEGYGEGGFVVVSAQKGMRI